MKLKNWMPPFHLHLKLDLYSMYILLGEECLQRLDLRLNNTIILNGACLKHLDLAMMKLKPPMIIYAVP